MHTHSLNDRTSATLDLSNREVILNFVESQQDKPRIVLDNCETLKLEVLRIVRDALARNLTVAVIGPVKLGKYGKIGLQPIRNMLIHYKIPIQVHY